MALHEMSCKHSDKVSECVICMIDLNAMTDSTSWVHSVQVAKDSYVVSPALASELAKRTDTEIVGNMFGVNIMVSQLLPIEVSNDGQEEA